MPKGTSTALKMKGKKSKIAAVMRDHAPTPRRKKVQQRGLPAGCYFRGQDVVCPPEALSALGSLPKLKRIKPRRARHRKRGK